MAEQRRALLEERLREAEARLQAEPRGTVAWRDAQAAVRQFERLLLTGELLPPTPNSHHRARDGRR